MFKFSPHPFLRVHIRLGSSGGLPTAVVIQQNGRHVSNKPKRSFRERGWRRDEVNLVSAVAGQQLVCGSGSPICAGLGGTPFGAQIDRALDRTCLCACLSYTLLNSNSPSPDTDSGSVVASPRHVGVRSFRLSKLGNGLRRLYSASVAY